jgi:uncharacterized metal-binding protein YceD (DUF177 family)
MIARLLSGGPGVRLQPFRYASEGRELRLHEPLAAFERLAGLVEADAGDVSARLSFRRDDDGNCRVEGEADAVVRVRCANCEAVGELALHADLDLCVVRSGRAAAALAPALDPLVMDKDHLTAVELLEDDLILNLPEQPCRRDPDCPFRPAWTPQPPPEPPVERRNPFEVLAHLRRGDGATADDDATPPGAGPDSEE